MFEIKQANLILLNLIDIFSHIKEAPVNELKKKITAINVE
jgi:hypothetical protein